MLRVPWIVVVTLGLTSPMAACARSHGGADVGGVPTVAALFESVGMPQENIDSLAYWPGQGWIVATAKATDRLLVYDGASGRLLQQVGGPGDQAGQFRRPNGVAVVDDLLLVVERDNHRVQVLSLPDLAPAGMVGAEELAYPYGLVVFRGTADLTYDLYVTDSLQATAGAAGVHAKRVKHYRLTRGDDGVRSQLVTSFGDSSGPGGLPMVESIGADPVNDRLLIADESEAGRDIKVYTLGGSFTGTVIGHGLFHADPEGIALFACGDGGVWVTTDQQKTSTVFHLFDRRDLRLLGSISAGRVANTDGIALSASPPSTAGTTLFAVDNDEAVAAFSWHAVASALGLPADCDGAALLESAPASR